MPAFTARMAGVWTITAPSESEAADLRDEAFACWLRNCAPPEGVTFEGDDGPTLAPERSDRPLRATWFEVRQPYEGGWMRLPDHDYATADDSADTYTSLEDAQDAAHRHRAGGGLGGPLWIERVTSEKVEDVP